MRRLLRDVAEHRELGDVTTLTDPTVVNMIDDADGRARGGRRVIEPEVAVRPAVPGDAPAIARLLAAGLTHPRRRGPLDAPSATPRRRSGSARPAATCSSRTTTARSSGVCQVLLLQHLQHAGGKVAEVESVHVGDEHRRHGVGAALLDAAVTWAAAKGCYRVQLTSHEDRGDAHRFYAARGFVPSHVGFKLVLDDEPDDDAPLDEAVAPS